MKALVFLCGFMLFLICGLTYMWLAARGLGFYHISRGIGIDSLNLYLTFISVMLTAVTIFLGVFAIVLGFVAFFSYREIKLSAEKAAEKSATDAIETAKKEMRQIAAEEAKSFAQKAVPIYIADNLQEVVNISVDKAMDEFRMSPGNEKKTKKTTKSSRLANNRASGAKSQD